MPSGPIADPASVHEIKPAHELYGEILLELDRPKEAREQFEQVLALTPGRAASLFGLARASARSGDKANAERTYAELRKMWRNADPDLPETEELRNIQSTTQRR